MLNNLYQGLDPVAFTFGPLVVRWYGLAYLLGFIFAALIIYFVARRWALNFDSEALTTLMACVVVGIIVGARLGYCLFYGDGYYLKNPLAILAINEGGMSFHGGLAGALIAGILAAKLTGIPYLTLADMGVIVAPIGLCLGRVANFINGELWGAPTDLPWGVVFGGAAGFEARHPSQLYEALLEGVILFIILFIMARRKPPWPRGTYLGVFLALYGIMRFAIEFVREPDVQLGYLFGGWFTMGQALSIPLVVGGLCLIVWASKTRLPQMGLPPRAQTLELKVSHKN